jgi:predicted nucleic acid-binding protein
MARANDSERYKLADASAAALAKHKKAELVTTDHEFKSVEKEIKINWPTIEHQI